MARDAARARARRDARVVNQRGLHARAAARFVKLAERFEASVEVSFDGVTVSGRSIMGLMSLTAARGAVVTLQGQGPEADEAVAALAGLIEAGFDEE